MKKLISILLICMLGLSALTACGTKSNETSQAPSEEPSSEESSRAEELNAMMIGRWIPEEGTENDVLAFGYMGDAGFTDDSSGQLCILIDYVNGDGGGSSAAECTLEGNQLKYTAFVSNYSAGGGVEGVWTVDADSISNGKAIINGIAYEKVTDDPSDYENLAMKAIEARR